MKKKIIMIVLIVLCLLLSYALWQYIRIKTAKVEVKLNDDLTLEVGTKRKVSSYIQDINGTIINDYRLNSSKLGDLEVPFEFINTDGIKVKYNFKVKVVDTIEPLIWLGNSYKVQRGSDINLIDNILCGDNYDNKPKCIIEGDYDLNKEGVYKLVFKATDKSGNSESQPFNLYVYEPNQSSDVNNKSEKINTSYSDVIKNYKNKDNRIGIDVSEFQKDIDFARIKKSGVDFMMIRIGGGTNGKYFLDKKFKRNIKLAKKYNIDVGIYFYSYANSIKSARKDARWVLKQLGKNKLQLPIAFDWEEWRSFNAYNLSFFKLTSIAESFLDEVKSAGYDGMLYSSKTYLDYIWLETDYDIWLAHYTSKTDYKGKYKMWQMCENGKVDGIDTDVDIDIMYK